MDSQDDDRGRRLDAARQAAEDAATDPSLNVLQRIRISDELAAAEAAWPGIKPDPDLWTYKRLLGAARDAMSVWRASVGLDRAPKFSDALNAVRDHEDHAAKMRAPIPRCGSPKPASGTRSFRQPASSSPA